MTLRPAGAGSSLSSLPFGDGVALNPSAQLLCGESNSAAILFTAARGGACGAPGRREKRTDAAHASARVRRRSATAKIHRHTGGSGGGASRGDSSAALQHSSSSDSGNAPQHNDDRRGCLVGGRRPSRGRGAQPPPAASMLKGRGSPFVTTLVDLGEAMTTRGKCLCTVLTNTHDENRKTNDNHDDEDNSSKYTILPT